MGCFKIHPAEEPDSAIPVQYRLLASALIYGAYCDLFPITRSLPPNKYQGAYKKTYQILAKQWFSSEKTDPCSMRWCCDILEICPKKLYEEIQNQLADPRIGQIRRRIFK